MKQQTAVFIGIQGTVLALDAATGTEVWRTPLKGSSFVNIVALDSRIYATSRGVLFALDAATGQILWSNKLKGLGTGLVAIAGAHQMPLAAEKQRQDDAAAAAAAASA